MIQFDKRNFYAASAIILPMKAVHNEALGIMFQPLNLKMLAKEVISVLTRCFSQDFPFKNEIDISKVWLSWKQKLRGWMYWSPFRVHKYYDDIVKFSLNNSTTYDSTRFIQCVQRIAGHHQILSFIIDQNCKWRFMPEFHNFMKYLNLCDL